MSSTRRTVRNVLSIDGCGFRGRTQLLVLRRLMELHSRDPDDPSRPSDVFDLICGTATGGLIAILLGRLRMTCGEAIQAYDSLESAIFDATPPLTIRDILARREPFDTSHFQKRLADLIRTHAGNSDALMLADDEHNRRCRTLVTVVPPSAAVDTDAERIRSYAAPARQDGSKEPETIPGHVWTIREAALGTTACPRLFSPLTLSEHGFMAANTSGFSNPSMIAYVEALRLFDPNPELTLISLGMGLRNEHDYGSLSTDGIDQMITQLGVDRGDDRSMKLISQMQLVATSTQIKHLRLGVLIGRNPKRDYMRLDPERNNNRFVFVDYTQKVDIEHITNAYFQKPPDSLNEAVEFIQRVDSKWMELRGYTSDSVSTAQPNPQADMSNMNPRQIMRECIRWEVANSNRDYISCFTINSAGPPRSVKMITGDIHPHGNNDSTLFVRILLDDGWRFFPQRRAPESNWDGQKGPATNPIEAILKADKTQAIRAFSSDGRYTTSDVAPDQVNIYEFGFSLPYHGTWVRTGTA